MGEEGGELIGRGGGREGGVGTSGNVLESSIGLLGGNGAVGLPPRPSSRSVSSRPLMGGPLPLPPIGLGASSSSFTSQGRGGDGGGSSNISRSSSGRHGGENGSRGGSRGEGGGIGPLFEEAKAMSPRRDRVEVVGRTARPQSANQKFLKKYNLAQYNLFSPS